EEAEILAFGQTRERAAFCETARARVEEKDCVRRAAVAGVAPVADGEVFAAVEVEVVEDEAVLLRVESARLLARLWRECGGVFVKLDVRQPQGLERRLRALSEELHGRGAAAPV